jgi:hypothetical protein
MKNIKLLVVIVSFALTSAAIAGQTTDDPNQDLYNALGVKEVDMNPPNLAGSSHFRKSVGGLVCSMTSVVYPGAKPKYDCKFEKNVEKNPQAIYQVLNAKEVDVSGDTEGSTRKIKSAGGFVCTETIVISSRKVKETYSCAFRRTGAILDSDTSPRVSGTAKDKEKPSKNGIGETEGNTNPNTVKEAR